MLNWVQCYLSGRHDFGVWCEPGEIFLRCVHCGRRSSGWAVETRAEAPSLAAGSKRMAKATTTPLAPARVLPFDRAAS